MYGPVPIGCCVPKVPVGWKTPFESTVPASAWYFFSAVGLAMPKFVSASAPRNDDERRVRKIVTLYCPLRLAALVEALVRARVARRPDVRSRRRRCSSSRSRASLCSGAGEVVPAVEVGADRGRVERRAVLELDALAERERPGKAVLASPSTTVASGGTSFVVPGFRPTRPSKIWSIGRSDSPSETSGAVEHDRIGRGPEDERRIRLRPGSCPGGQQQRGREQDEWDEKQRLSHPQGSLLVCVALPNPPGIGRVSQTGSCNTKERPARPFRRSR